MRERCAAALQLSIRKLTARTLDSTKPMASNEAANEACLSEADGEAICIELEEDGCEHFTDHYLPTPYGQVKLVVQGDKKNPAILTYHDIGLNYRTNFEEFLANTTVKRLTGRFCWYHVNAPGQEEAEENTVEEPYPDVTQLAEQVNYITTFMGLESFIGLGVGAGANILCRLAVICPEKIRGLVLINLAPCSLSWTNSIQGKVACWRMKDARSLSRFAMQHLVKQAFGPSSKDVDQDLVSLYKEYVAKQNLHNLAAFMKSYYRRSSIAEEFAHEIQCDCLFIVSSNFLYKDDVVKLCSMMDHQKTTFLEVSKTSGLLLVDQPGRIYTALKLFLQGLGLVPALSICVKGSEEHHQGHRMQGPELVVVGKSLALPT